MELQRRSYDGAEFVTRGVNNIQRLEWSAPDLRIPKVIFADGTEYEINCQDMSDKQRRQMKLADYFEIILKIDQIAQAKQIIRDEACPGLSRLDGMQINKNGVTWYRDGVHAAGTYYRHDETEDGRANTTELYNELKALAPGANFNAAPGRRPGAPQGNDAPAGNNGANQNQAGDPAPVGAAGAAHQRGAFASNLDIDAAVKDETSRAVAAKADRVANDYRGDDDHGHVTWQWQDYANALITNEVMREIAEPLVERVEVNKRQAFGAAITHELREHAFEKFHDTLTASSEEVLRELFDNRAWRRKSEAEVRTKVMQDLRDVYADYRVDDLNTVADVQDGTLKEWIRAELRSDSALQRLLSDERIRDVRDVVLNPSNDEGNRRGFLQRLRNLW